MEQPSVPALAPLKRWERCGLFFLLAGAIAFGVLVEIRSVFLTRRMGDFGCYARGAWAVRAGADLYDVTCDNDWHYNYPPFLAILMVPLADPPRGQDTAGMTPFAVSVAVWYVFSVLCLIAGVHALARALEEKSPDPELCGQPHGCRRWWALRCWPILVCMAPIGCTLMRGQVNILVLAFVCGLIAALIRGAHFRAGLCLAGAACVKVYPIFLLVYPLWQRNWRCLGGCLAGLFIGLVVVPVVALGPARTLAVYDKYATVMLGPALGGGNDDTRVDELLGVNSTWSQSFKAVVHKTIYLDIATRPLQIAPWLNLAHLALGAALTLLVLLVGRRAQGSATGIVCTVGSLCLLMIVFCPVCHLHYFTLAVPLVMVVVAKHWENRTTVFPGLALTAVLSVFFIANALPEFDEFPELRDLGLAMYSGLLLMGVALYQALGAQGIDRQRGANVPRAAGGMRPERHETRAA